MYGKYWIKYRPSLGSFLDIKKINWRYESDDTIEISLRNEEELFALALEYAEWYQTIS